jgi:hypothetical protein
MGVKYVLSEPTPPGWWAKNKPVVYAIAGLAAGIYLAGGCDTDAAPAPSPSPRPSITTTPSGSTR